MGRRKRKRSKRKLLLITALSLLVAGFLARRTLIPYILDSLHSRPHPLSEPGSPLAVVPLSPAPAASEPKPGAQLAPAPNAPVAVSRAEHSGSRPGVRERINKRDRRELDRILQQKVK